VQGFRLALPPEQPPLLLVAALREGMLRLAGRIGDGAILNWLAPEDVPTVAAFVREQNAEREIVARIFVVPTDDAELARSIGRRAIAAYLNVPVYAAFHDWLGRGARLAGMRAAWAAGDRARALTEIGDDLVDELIVHGSPERCRERVQAYVENGVATPVLALLPHGGDPVEAARQLAPA
jgi:alkanesulfonate monooxygenase SsuD/methylene tetrahydromethanopterin reductase-like flavin-dependent oxidoreductase (luciferase family)